MHAMTEASRIARGVAGASAVFLVLAFGGAAHAAGSATAVAPYMDMAGANPSALDDAITSGGLTDFTAAFVVGNGCIPVWDDGTPVADATAINQHIAAARSEGAEPIISFGGQGGTDLARSCTNLKKLTAGYQAVIDRFAVTRVDFDVEGAALDDGKSITRRFSAIKSLEAATPGLIVSATLPVGPGGLLDNGFAFLQAASDDGVRIDLVNIMAMDYTGARDMGATAVSAAKGTLAQMRSLWPTLGYANLGVTAMIGVNDVSVEVFTMQNAKTLVKFARKNGIGRLGFWSINRDRACAVPGGAARNDCSGVTQSPGAFTKAFVAAG